MWQIYLQKYFFISSFEGVINLSQQKSSSGILCGGEMVLATSMDHWLLPSGHLKVQDRPCSPNSPQHHRSGAHPAHSCYDSPGICQKHPLLSAPGQHCRPIMNSRGHTAGTEQGKTQGKDSEKERCDFENRRKPAQMKGENPF